MTIRTRPGSHPDEATCKNMTEPYLTTLSLTSTHLLDGLKDPHNQAVWGQYVERYRPLLVRYGRRLGLREDEAEDVAQQILIEFSKAYQAGKYDRDKGRLRVWLFGIARNLIRNWQRRARRRERQVGFDSQQTDVFHRIEDNDALGAAWEQEWRDAVLKQCLVQVRAEVQPQTFEAFERFAYSEKPAEEVARELGITANAVFSAKRRVLRRIRELMPLVDEQW